MDGMHERVKKVPFRRANPIRAKVQLTLSVINVPSVEVLVKKREWVEGGDQIS